MAITLNGTTGITTPDITSDGSLKIDASAPDDSLVVDASGNVGIGTSSPGTKLDVSEGAIRTTIASKTASFDAAGGSIYTELNDGTKTWRVGVGIQAAGIFTIRNHTDSLPAVNIDSSGNVLVGTTSAGVGNSAKVLARQTSSGGYAVVADAVTNGGTYYLVGFQINGTTPVGQIISNGSTTTYATSSDYRLKENIAPMTGALAKVAALKPVTYTWKASGEADEGFIAHELQEVCPSAVTGEKDAVNEDGSIKPQGIDTSFLVATLAAAIQELKAINDAQAQTIESLTARVVALEGQP